MTRPRPQPGAARAVARWALAALLAAAGASHLTWGRRGYRIVVPDWAVRLTTLDKDAIVVASGAVELMLAGALVALPRERRPSAGWSPRSSSRCSRATCISGRPAARRR